MPKQLTDINDIVLNGIYDAFDLGFTTGAVGEQLAQSEEMIRLQGIIHNLEENNTSLQGHLDRVKESRVNLREMLDQEHGGRLTLQATIDAQEEDKVILRNLLDIQVAEKLRLETRIDDLEDRNTSLEHSLKADLAIMEAQDAYIASLQESLATIHNLTT